MQKLQGFVEAGNTTLTITGAAGTITRKVQGSFPSATITVYLAGTTDLATLYSDNSSTAKANPFTASASGVWFFYAGNGRYDVRFSGGGIAAPFTISDISAFDGQVGLDGADYDITDLANDFVSVKKYGALGDGVRVFDAAMTNGSAVLSSASGNFTGQDIGKKVVVEGAGAASATLVGVIVSVGGSTSVMLSVAASTTVTDVHSIWATDDTEAIQAALDDVFKVYIPAGVYGISTIRLKLGSQMWGDGPSTTILSRQLTGAGGDTLAMVTDEAAQSITLCEFALLNNHVGGTVDGIDLGTQGSEFRFANGSYINNVRVMGVSAVGVHLGCNIGYIGQVWVQNFPGQGTPVALSIPSSVGFKSTDTMLIAEIISVEGHWEITTADLGAGDSEINIIQIEPTFTNPTGALITFNAPFQDLERVFCVQWNGNAATWQDLIRINNGVQAIHLGPEIVNSSAFPITLTNMVHDVNTNIQLPADSARWTVTNYNSDQRNSWSYDDTYKVRMGMRWIWGASSVVAENDITLGYLANAYSVTGSTRIDRIFAEDWPPGSELKFLFTGNPLIKHNVPDSGDFFGFYLAGEQDWQASDNDTLTVLFNGFRWYETSRSVNSPLFTDFTPFYSSNIGNAGVTFDSPVVTNLSRYSKNGKTVLITVNFDAVLNPVTPNALFFQVPAIILPNNTLTYSTCLVSNDGTYEAGICRTRSDLDGIQISRNNFVNWSSEATINVALSFAYEAQ